MHHMVSLIVTCLRNRFKVSWTEPVYCKLKAEALFKAEDVSDQAIEL